MPTTLPVKVLLKCFLRSYLSGAAYNTRGLQNIGFIQAITPGLEGLYQDREAFAAACRRYLDHYNCHPFWTPLLLGIFLHMEHAIAQGLCTEAALTSIKNTASNTLSAIGDSVFRGSLLPLWALLCCGLALDGHVMPALWLSLAVIIILQLLRLLCFIAGVRHGLKVLGRLRRLDLINLGDIIKLINSLLLVGVLFLILQIAESGGQAKLSGWAALEYWGALMLGLGLCVWVVRRLHLPRIFLMMFVVASLCFFA